MAWEGVVVCPADPCEQVTTGSLPRGVGGKIGEASLASLLGRKVQAKGLISGYAGGTVPALPTRGVSSLQDFSFSLQCRADEHSEAQSTHIMREKNKLPTTWKL